MRKPAVLSVRAHVLSPAQRQFLRFCLVGASGYAVNLAVYAALLALGLAYLAAATVSFLVAAVSNFLWNRAWTFEVHGARWLGQCSRAVAVSGLALGLNQLFLVGLVGVGADHVGAQAAAILLVTPFSFAANKLWAFAGSSTAVGEFTGDDRRGWPRRFHCAARSGAISRSAGIPSLSRR